MIVRWAKVALALFLTAAIAGTAYWGYREHQDKNSILIKAENNYQRAFHNLNNTMANLEDELGKAIAVNSRDMLAPCLANIWRLAYQAQTELGQLPLTLTPFHRTDQFLAGIADFTYDIGMRDLSKEPLTDKEWERLKELHAQAEKVQQDLRSLQRKVMAQNLRWMDVELAILAEDAELSKDILDGIETLDKQVEGYIETEGGSKDLKYTETRQKQNDLLQGKKVTKEEATDILFKFMRLKEKPDVQVEENKGSEIDAYHIRFKHPERDSEIIAEVSQKGGHVLWFLDSRDIEKSKIGLYDAQQIAEQFLRKRGITSVTAVDAQQYDNVGVFEFVRLVDKVRIYPDLIRIKVALDNGDVLGYEAKGYVLNHHGDKKISPPKLTEEEARKKVNKNLKVEEVYLSLIETDAGQYTLCYEMLGTIEQETYRIFINAYTGKEEKVEKMKHAELLV